MIRVVDVGGGEASYDATSFESDASGQLYVRKTGTGHPVAVYAPGQWVMARRDEDPPAQDEPDGGAAATIGAKAR